MAHIGIVTCDIIRPVVQSQESPLYTHDDIHMIRELRKRGHSLEPLPWRRTTPKSGAFDLILQRSPWDYMENQQAYLDWLQGWSDAGVTVEHDLPTTLWNIDKHYLQGLEERGVSCVPTYFLEPEDPQTLEQVAHSRSWGEVVIKPAISGAARDTFRLTLDELGTFQSTFEELRRGRTFLVQPFVEAVLSEGEWSLIFFDGEYSHSVLKRAKPGDYRVQDDHGGTVYYEQPTDAMIEQAAQVLAAAQRELLYARVDGILLDGQLHIVELEAIEPELFLRADPVSAQRFADAIEKRL